MATTTADKIRENRLRKAAKRQGYEVTKSRRRDPRAVDYGGYMIVDPHTNSIEAGGWATASDEHQRRREVADVGPADGGGRMTGQCNHVHRPGLAASRMH